MWNNQVFAPQWCKKRNDSVDSWCFHADSVSLNLFIPSSKREEIRRYAFAFKKQGRRREVAEQRIRNKDYNVWLETKPCFCFQADDHTSACLLKPKHFWGGNNYQCPNQHQEHEVVIWLVCMNNPAARHSAFSLLHVFQ